ncbi:hypothetical protein KAS31_04695 [Candidatus Parcubacteria bacterium]|nr:hypothetical protein [Candidatus Parcubacteria bacterium]
MYSDIEEKLNAIKPGEKIGNTLDACSICPNPNILRVCDRCFEIEASGFHPEKGIEICSIAICSQTLKENCIFGYSRKVTGEKVAEREKEHSFTVWDRGEHIYSNPENTLIALRPGETLKDVLSSCTICPVGNMTCNEYFTINVVSKEHATIHKIMVCPLSVTNGDDCPLSK